MKLSKRMEAIVEMAGRMKEKFGKSLVYAEAGCDHAYLSMELLRRGYADYVYAMDIAEGPLLRAAENIRKELGNTPYEQRIETRLSDGLLNLGPGKAKGILIAGMGGGTMLHVLKEGCKAVNGAEVLLLQPQSEIPKVRQYLYENGFQIEDEDMVYEEGKYYSLMAAVKRPAPEKKLSLRQIDYLYGPVNLQNENEVLYSCLLREMEKMEAILKQLSQNSTEDAQIRRQELKIRYKLLGEALAEFD